MGSLIDLTGKRFGKLVVIQKAGSRVRGIKYKVKTPLWKCECDCGNIIYVTSAELRSGDTKSCGCFRINMLTERSTTHGDGHRGAKYYRLYRIWFHMRKRCSDCNDASYGDYGKRGIKVCDEWSDYQTFKKWSLQNGYQENLTIDRINNDGDYCPDNCRWVGYSIQANNRRSCRYVEINGEKKTISEWCEIFKTNPYTAYSRIDRFGWNPQKAVSYKPEKKHFYKNIHEDG